VTEFPSPENIDINELQRFFEQLWQRALNPFWVCKPVGNDFEMVMANPAAQRINNKQRAGTRLSELAAEHENGSALLAGYFELMKTGAPVEFEQRPWMQGKEYLFRTVLVPIKDDKGQITHIWGTAHNLTDFLDPQKELLAINQMLDAKVKERTDQLNRAMLELERLSVTDDLTQLSNRRFFNRELRKEISRASRTQSALSVVYLDLDYFKQFNDCYGHEAGDHCLRMVAEALTACAQRSEDVVARYGGEEFVLLLPGLRAEQALLVAEDVSARVAALDCVPETSLRATDVAPITQVTISAGVAEYLPDNTAEQLLHQADQALYQAKQEGRNRIVVAAPAVD